MVGQKEGTVAARDSIINPILLTPDEPGMPRLQFVALDRYEPRGQARQVSEYVALHSFPWFSEVVGRYSDREGNAIDSWWCVTRMPIVGSDFEMFAACIDTAPEALFSVLSGRDHGGALADLIAREWPDIYSMLEASTSGDLGRRLLVCLDNGNGRQWLVADVVQGEARHNITAEHAEDLILSSLSVALRTFDWITSLPNLHEIGPNLATRRREGVAGVLTGLVDIGEAISGAATGSLNPTALRSALMAASAMPGHLRGVFS